MRRRDFLYLVGANSVAAVMATDTLAKTTLETLREKKQITAGDLQDYLRSLYEVKEPSCDHIIVGKPENKVSKVGTAWMGYWRICRKAVDAGVDTLVVHEPTFYSHWDLGDKTAQYRANKVSEAAYEKLIAEKKKWIEDHGLTIIRSHDVMDRVGKFGMPFALGQTLGFSDDDIVRSRLFYNVYGIDPTPAKKVAQRIADHLKPLGQPGVAFYGDPGRPIKTVGVGTGCICDPIQFAPMNPDLFIAIDDKVRTWIQTTYAEDSGHPLVVINHGTSEECGMKALNGHLSQAFPNLECVHVGDGCSYKWIAAR
ncbi:MAG: Nif3-like dinuclear metal center hexameric protein [Pirellulales bacterium]|nr:Nif3-like dinuclear metal center hexameric protein [Pirellulales bacterium]